MCTRKLNIHHNSIAKAYSISHARTHKQTNAHRQKCGLKLDVGKCCMQTQNSAYLEAPLIVF